MRSILEYTQNNLAYMIVLLGVMVLAAVFWNLYRREKRIARRIKEENSNRVKFYNAFGNNPRTAYIFVSEKDFRALYATPNLELVTGIKQEDLKTDIDLLNKLIPRSEAREIQRKLKKWDRREVFSSEMNSTAEKGKKIFTTEKRRYITARKPADIS